MKLHGNAALSWQGRRRLARRVVVEGWTLSAAAEAAGVSVRCARRWSSRYRIEGEGGLFDRSSAPRRVANRTPEQRVAVIVGLRGLRMTAAEIAETLGMALSTVWAILKREGMGRLGRIGLEQPVRYERARPGELVHLDVKKLGRIEGGAGKRAFGDSRRRATRTYTDKDGHRRGRKGWEYVHVAIDDHSRLAYAEVLPDEKALTAAGFLRRTAAHYQRQGITVERILTDNGSCYRATTHALACRTLGIKHSRTRPYRPQTNGCESRGRFRLGPLPGSRRCCLCVTRPNGWLWHYNHRRRHSALGHRPRSAEPTCLGPTASSAARAFPRR
jgi:transposase InsO family protein